MQIISGLAGGISLNVPKGLNVRPTAVRARKALFDSLGNFDRVKVMDLFAGSGALGLEAASRGAEKVVFIEKNPKHCRIIKENIAKIENSGINCEFRIFTGDVKRIIKTFHNLGPVDYIFADPPYNQSFASFSKITEIDEFRGLAINSLLVWELPHSLPNKSENFVSPFWNIEKRRNFGNIEFLFLKVKGKI